MKKLLKKITEKRDNFNEALRNRLDNLSPEAKVNIILRVMAFYLLATIFVVINAVKGNDNALRLQHIEAVKIIDSPLKKPAPNDTTYNYQPY